ncbi:MAG: acetyl-CoA carboxylase biotin carboxylase subunit [Prolixibacteraceae bacterium]|jgi:acetyl-CoA carboxylase biotin carboxylase subunit|nr:acetyl-CoA carboxylase biotin carboxylase subunit [Prolixibacteraceae bacterium]
MIKKILVANRGEIAVRIMRSCREMGIGSVAVYSTADRNSMHVRYANEAYYIGDSPSSESYLNIDKIIDTAKQSGADAIHPGYGFLSENAGFARKVNEAGIIFIGPTPESMEAMGDKVTAREIMLEAGVNVVPGTDSRFNNDDVLAEKARKIGYPLMIKASAGGGGKGMRLVRNEHDLVAAYKMAKSEARTAFGDDTVYIEKYIESPHHIEFQVLADKHGNVVHLFERECSVQRRHQKVVEETPSPFITESLRNEMGKQAIEAARYVNYVGAGTVEFLVDGGYNFYFLEMNTRLQVEHPITERVTGVDLVKQQILIAEGQVLKLKQEELRQFGHAIECRIYAEDPANNFMPSPGKIEFIAEPLGLGVRTDGYVYEGYEIPIFYDPMISKLIVWAQTRKETISRMQRALYEYKISGIKTSIPFLKRIMNTPAFIKGEYNTHFIENNQHVLLTEDECNKDCELLSIIISYIDFIEKNNQQELPADNRKTVSSWKNYSIQKSINRI